MNDSHDVMNLLADEVLEQIEWLLTEIQKMAADGIPIIVEGIKDVKALKRLGVSGAIYKISNGNSLLNFVEGFSESKKIIVLTDFDRAGGELAKFITKQARTLGIEPVTEFRDKLKPLVCKNVKDIEGLAKFLQRERER